MNNLTKFMLVLVLVITSFMAGVSSAYASDQQTFIPCGGDDETIIMCIGDLENSPLVITEKQSGLAGDEEKTIAKAIEVGTTYSWVLIPMIGTMLFLFIFIIARKRRRQSINNI